MDKTAGNGCADDVRWILTILMLPVAALAESLATNSATRLTAAWIDAKHVAHLEWLSRQPAGQDGKLAPEVILRELMRAQPANHDALESLAKGWDKQGEPTLAFMLRLHLAAPAGAGVKDSPVARQLLDMQERVRTERDAPGRPRHREAMEALSAESLEDIRQGRLGAGEARLRKALQEHPVEPVILRQLASLFAAGDEWALCAAVYGYAHSLYPSDGEITANLALTCGRLGLWEQGLGHLKALLAESPDAAFLNANAARFAFQLGRYAEASAFYANLTRAEPEKAAHWSRYGEALLESGDDRLLAAKIAFLKVLELEPKNQQAWYHLAAVEAMRGNLQESSDWLLKVAPILGPEGLSRVLNEEPFRAHPGLKALLRRVSGEKSP
jgi:tetratricopeptide (TPR) repeat protein